MRADRQWFSVRHKRFHIYGSGMRGVGDCILLTLTIYMQPLKRWAVRMESLIIWLDNDTDSKSNFSHTGAFALRCGVHLWLQCHGH